MAAASYEVKQRILRDEYLDNISLREVLSLGFYFKTVTQEFKYDYLSKLILNLKATRDDLNTKHPAWQDWQIRKTLHHKQQIIEWFAKIIVTLFEKNRELVFIAIPSSKRNNLEHGPTILVEKISSHSKKFICGNGCLIRTIDIKPLHHGGNRSSDRHRASLEVVDKERVRGKTIVLIDDIITTGNSMMVVKELLLQAGAHQIICFTLGRTVTVGNKTQYTGYFELFTRIFQSFGSILPESIPLYNSNTRTMENLLFNKIIGTNLQLFDSGVFTRTIPRAPGPAILTAFQAQAITINNGRYSSCIISDEQSELSDDEIIDEILDEAPNVDDDMIRLAIERDLDLRWVFAQLGHNNEDGDYSSDQQLFAVNMQPFGYDFLNLGGDDELEYDDDLEFYTENPTI